MRTARSITQRRLVGACLAGVLTLALAACGSDDDSAEPTVSDAGSGTAAPGGDIAPVQVAIVGVADGFAPGSVTVPAGTEVVWTNIDGIPHTSTARDGLWDSGNMEVNGTFGFTATEPGSYSYFCSIHPSMVGDIIVE